MPRKLAHIHGSFRRMNLRKHMKNVDPYYVYQCGIPGCRTYYRPEQMMRKEVLCACGRKFIFDYDSLKRVKPHCEECTKVYDYQDAEKIARLEYKRTVKDNLKKDTVLSGIKEAAKKHTTFDEYLESLLDDVKKKESA